MPFEKGFIPNPITGYEPSTTARSCTCFAVFPDGLCKGRCCGEGIGHGHSRKDPIGALAFAPNASRHAARSS